MDGGHSASVLPVEVLAEREDLEKVKTVALACGVRIAPSVLSDLGGLSALTVHEYPTTAGITVLLPQDVLVNAPFDEPYCASSPLELTAAGGRLELRLDDVRVEVLEVLPLPGYLDVRDHRGRAVGDVAMSHGDRVRLSPIDGCAFNCDFCDLPGRYRPRSVEQILSALDIALEDEALPARHILISGGSPGQAPTQQDYFRDVCVAVLHHVRASPRKSPLSVDIMMSARKDGPAFVDEMVAEGVHGFSFNVEVFSEEGARTHLSRKHKLARPHLARMIERAVEALGSGTGRVRSLIIPGLETETETLDGVEWLASLGCHPVLSPFRPSRGTALANRQPLPAAALTSVLCQSRDIVGRHGVALGPECVPCQHNTLSFPWDVGAREPA
jgi:hypothetical protein